MKQISCYLFMLAGVFSTSMINPPLPSVQMEACQSDEAEHLCMLPQPTNLIVTAVTTSWATFQWDVAKGAAFYRVRTIINATNQVFQSVVVPAAPGSYNSYKVEGLLPGLSYSVRVSSVCPNGIESQ